MTLYTNSGLDTPAGALLDLDIFGVISRDVYRKSLSNEAKDQLLKAAN